MLTTEFFAGMGTMFFLIILVFLLLPNSGQSRNDGSPQTRPSPPPRPVGNSPVRCERPGYDKLWLWFDLTRASWLTLPRSLMHEMPDEWQSKMADLLTEWDDTWVNQPDLKLYVSAKRNGKFCKIPSVLTNYRHPLKIIINSMRGKSDA